MSRTEQHIDPAAAWAAAIARSPLSMIVVAGRDPTVRAANYAFGGLLGRPGERLTGQRLEDVLPDAAAAAANPVVDRVRQTARPEFGVEVEIAGHGAPMRYWRLAVWPILDSDDRPDGICVQASDVTEQVTARRRERELTEAVREANDRLLQAGIREQELADAARRHSEKVDGLLHSLTEGVAMLDQTAGVAMMNAVGRTILGIQSGEERVPIDAYRDLELQAPDGTPIPREHWPFDRALAGERFANDELVVIRRDGSRARVAFHGSGVSGQGGASDLGIVVFRDVTEFRRLEELQAQYTSLISHDLRAPLGAMLGYADILEPELRRRGLERAAGFAERIRSAAERMRTMVEDLTHSTRADKGGLELHREPTDLRELVSSALEHVATPEDRARVRVDVPESVPLLFVDPERLSHAITNLVTNALKYSPPDEDTMLRIERRRREIHISVADQGPGIPRDELPRLFQRFYRASGAESGTGLGLGLYIARLVVEAHGGRIWAESEVGKGSTFHIALPVEDVPPSRSGEARD